MKTFTTLLCVAVLAVAAAAQAQQPTNLTPPALGHWDVAGQLALLSRNKSDLSQWDHWYSVASISGSAGRYWRPHFKTELEIGAAGEGTIDGTEETPVPGQGLPYIRYRDHKLQETTVGATGTLPVFR